MGFPFTSAPVSFFLALDHGTAFAAAAASGSIASGVAQAAFAIVYARTARRGPLAFAAATLAFAAVGSLIGRLEAPPAVLAAVTAAALAIALRLMPAPSSLGHAAGTIPRWDLPARMVVATALVLLITTFAPLLGPFASGVVASFPVYASVLAVFALRQLGPAAAADVMRGLTAGLFGFTAFFLAIALLVEPAGIATAFAVAIVVVLAVQGLALAIFARPRSSSVMRR